MEGLDSPGEWLVNTETGEIYLWPENSKPGKDIYTPSLRQLILVEGKNDKQDDNDVPVKGIHFEGISFTHTDRGVWNKDDVGIQHDWEMLDKGNTMLHFRGAENCVVDACHFYSGGGNAIRLDLYAQNITVKNSLFHVLGQSAVMMIGYGPGTKDVNHHNTIFNNHIHHCGKIYLSSQMITAWQSGYNTSSHNCLYDIPRKAICISGVRPIFLDGGKEI